MKGDEYTKPPKDTVTEQKSSLPRGYIKFVERNSRFWTRLNIYGVLASLAFGAGAYQIMQIDISQMAIEQECLGLRNAVAGLLFLHALNGVFNLMAICGLDLKLLNTLALMTFFGTNLAILVWA